MNTLFSGWFDGNAQFDFPQGTWPGYTSAGIGCLYHVEPVDSENLPIPTPTPISTSTPTPTPTSVNSTTRTKYTFTFGRMSSAYSIENTIIIRLILSVPKIVNDIIFEY